MQKECIYLQPSLTLGVEQRPSQRLDEEEEDDNDNNNDNNNNHHLVDFTVPMSHRVKMEERKKINKYLDLARKLKKQWNMRVTMIWIVVGMLGTVPKDLEKRLDELEIRGRIKTIQTSVLLSLARILQGVLETRGDLMSFPVKDKHLTLV